MRIVIACSGGVAALKVPTLLRRLRDAGHEVRVAASQQALRFVTELSLAVAAEQAPLTDARWFAPEGDVAHIAWARWAQLLIVVPASADALASAASGRADDLISALLLSGPERVLWVPAMNPQMYTHPLVQRNLETLKTLGHDVLEPVLGTLASRAEGEGRGRLPEPEAIVAYVQRYVQAQDLQSLRVLVSAGPTREYLDPVRYLSNPSSGKMGYAVAEAAQLRGATVTLVSGPTALTAPANVRLEPVQSANDMLKAMQKHFAKSDIVVMSAAVADWQAANVNPHKAPKMGSRQTLELLRTPDILRTLAPQKGQQIPAQVVVGFAMETQEGVLRAAQKAEDKKLDFICLNYPTREGSAFGGDDNEITLVEASGAAEALPRQSKRALADIILSRALARYQKRQPNLGNENKAG